MYGWMFKIQHVLWLGACRACLGERAICVFAKNLTIGSVDYNSTLLMTCSYLDLSVVYQCYPCWTQVHVTTLLLSMMWPILISEVHKIKHVTNSWHYSLLGGGGELAPVPTRLPILTADVPVWPQAQKVPVWVLFWSVFRFINAIHAVPKCTILILDETQVLASINCCNLL